MSLDLSKCHIVGNHMSRLNHNTQLGAKLRRLPRCSPSAIIVSGVHQNKSKARSHKSQVRSKKSQVRCHKSQVRCQKTQVRCHKSQVKCQKSQVKSRNSKYHWLKFVSIGFHTDQFILTKYNSTVVSYMSRDMQLPTM